MTGEKYIFRKLMNITHLYCQDPHPLTYHTVLRYIAISYTRSELAVSHYINPSFYINGQLITKSSTINYMDYSEFDPSTIIKDPMVFLHFNKEDLDDNDYITCSAKATAPYTTIITLQSQDVNASIEVTMTPEGLQYKIIDSIVEEHVDLC